MAWSVPAIAFASSAPAATVSPLYTVSTGNVCKYPGRSVGDVKHAYMFPLTLTNVANEEVCIEIVSGSVNFDSGRTAGKPAWYTTPPHEGGVLAPNRVCIPVGGSVTYYYVVNNTGNSANESGTAVGTFLGTGSATGRQDQKTVRVAFGATPPDCKTGAPAVEPTESAAPATQEAAPAAPEAPATAEASQPAAPAATEPATPAVAATDVAAPVSEPTVATETVAPEVAATKQQP